MSYSQLSLFEKAKPETEINKIIIGNIQYRGVKLLTPKSNTHLFLFIHDAGCENYSGYNDDKIIFFKTEAERDFYLKELNEVTGTDKFGNNLDGRHKLGAYDDEKYLFGLQRVWVKSIFNIKTDLWKQI